MSVNLEIHLDHLEISRLTEEKIHNRLEKMEDGHHDITGAYLSVKQMSGKPTVHVYEATFVLYHKPENITASEKSEDIPEAIAGAVASVERQLRKARSAIRDRRKRARKAVEVPPEPPIE
ncbi:MAG: hypothetical protein COV99_08545 [Bacteroidetes bacterium CG12_big_fil_rev_8_21_14_0_65_60_17]|nr:MAG: hypothetical protein COV99_08545 [Bacteroidetes bacterium CG12_big_fil_rev_8_21_14_0_65_60_17]